MEYIPISPFMRPMTHTPLPVRDRHVPLKPVHKWEILRELSKARKAFGVSDRDLVVLQALLSFHPQEMLDSREPIVVFPSNARICERLNGMPCSTMRRHLSNLIAAGLLIRRDSPNGKRYRRKTSTGDVAYGFDLSPLHAYAPQIFDSAATIREDEAAMTSLRETVTLLRRDLLAMCTLGEGRDPALPLWEYLREAYAVSIKDLHRRSSKEMLEKIKAELSALLQSAMDGLEHTQAHKMSTSAVQNEQHYHNSNKEYFDIEPKERKIAKKPELEKAVSDEIQIEPDRPNLSLRTVLDRCGALTTFYPHTIKSWYQLLDAATYIRPAMGVSLPVWDEAKRTMGAITAAAVLAAMLERFHNIKSPSAYLRSLTKKADLGQFSCTRMLSALLPRQLNSC